MWNVKFLIFEAKNIEHLYGAKFNDANRKTFDLLWHLYELLNVSKRLYRLLVIIIQCHCQ